MALWHILVRGITGLWVPNGEPWDDGKQCRPGDDDFSVSGVKEVAGTDKRFNYVGTPNWQEG